MRTTVTLDDDLFARAKQEATTSGRTFSQVVEDALRDRLTTRPESEQPFKVKLRTYRGTGVRLGVDISDNAGTRDIMDGLA